MGEYWGQSAVGWLKGTEVTFGQRLVQAVQWSPGMSLSQLPFVSHQRWKCWEEAEWPQRCSLKERGALSKLLLQLSGSIALLWSSDRLHPKAVSPSGECQAWKETALGCSVLGKGKTGREVGYTKAVLCNPNIVLSLWSWQSAGISAVDRRSWLLQGWNSEIPFHLKSKGKKLLHLGNLSYRHVGCDTSENLVLLVIPCNSPCNQLKNCSILNTAEGKHKQRRS